MIHLSLNEAQMDYIATLIAERPWKEANGLLMELKHQVEQQQKSQVMAQSESVVQLQPNGHDGGQHADDARPAGA